MSREPIYCSIYWQTLYTVCTTHEREVRVRTHITKYVHTVRLTVYKKTMHKKHNAHKTCAKINQDDECKNQSLQCTGLLLHRKGLTKFQNLLYNYLHSVYSRYSTYLYCKVHAHVHLYSTFSPVFAFSTAMSAMA